MKTSKLNRTLSTLILMIAITSFAGLAIPSVSAMTPGLITSDTAEDSTANLSFMTTKDNSDIQGIAVYSSSVAINTAGCQTPSATIGPDGLPVAPAGEMKWTLRDNMNNIATIQVDGSLIMVPTPFGGGSFFITTAGVTAADQPLHWDKEGTANDGTSDDSTNVGGNVPDEFSYAICGEDNNDNEGPSGGAAGDTFNIVAQVGGEIMQINSISLILAGASANSMSVLAILGTVGIAIFGALYLKTKKTQN